MVRSRYEITAEYLETGKTSGVVRVLTPYVTGGSATLDIDRAPYASVTLELGALPQVIRNRIDPRRSNARLSVEVREYDLDDHDQRRGVIRFASMLVTEFTDDELANTSTITAVSLEQLLMDKLRIAGTTLNTNAATLGALVTYSLTDVLGAAGYNDTAAVASKVIPAGDRRLMQPGESHWDLLYTELDAQNARLLIDSNGTPYLLDRDAGIPADTIDYPRTSVEASTAGDTTGSMVTSLRRVLTRNDDWVDGVLIHYRWTKGDGTAGEGWQASGSGANTKGRVISRNRSVPADNNAQRVANRGVKRGTAYEVIGTTDLGARPGLPLTLIRPLGFAQLGTIRSVDFDFITGSMTLRTEIGMPT